MAIHDSDVRELVEFAHDAMCVRDADGTIKFWNAGATRLYGWSAEQAVGRISHELLSTRFPEPLARINDALSREGAWEGVLHHRTANGSELIVASRWVQRRPGDVVLEINRDETERHRLERTTRSNARQFELLTSHVPFLVAHCDRDLRFKYVNRAYAERFGLGPADLVGRFVTDILGPEAVRVIAPYIERVLSGERVEYEAWVPFSAVGLRYMRSIYTPETDVDGRVVGYIAAITDETERKNAEDALAQSRARLDFVATSADVGVWSCDVPLWNLIWNPACKAHFGLAPDDLVTIDTFYERMHPDDVAATRCAIDDAIQNGVSYDVEYRARQRDDSYRWIRAVGRTEYDEHGTPRRFEGITVDITRAKRAEERFREVADAMPQIVWSADADGVVDYLNRRWYELTGKPSGDPTTDDVLHSDDRAAAIEAFQQAIRTGEPYEREFRLWLAGEPEPRWFLGRALPATDEHGRVRRWYGTSTDIHEQKHVEAALVDSRDRLRAALDASATGTFRWEIDSDALDWDDNLDRLFGLTPGATARSLPEFLRLVHPDDRQRVIDACARCAAENADFVEEYRVVCPDGTVRWLFDHGRVFVTADGRRYMSGACVDITDRRAKEDALRAADRQKDEFLGMLAHEIRNPLAPVIYSTAILEQRIEDPSLKRPLEVISRQTKRMIRIVDDLLDVSRVTQGKIALQRERLTIAALLAHCVDSLRPAFEARRHTVQLHRIDPSLAVFADAVRLTQIVENLLINAAKYTPDGGRIDISAEAADNQVTIVVKDTGVGIAPDMQQRVFELFAQADTSLDRADGGLGIGLTLVDRLTRLHGGAVTAHSAGLGHGSTFTVQLPRVAAQCEAPARAMGESTAFARRVLVVDDNVDAAETLQTLIEMSGHTVRLAHDGVAAVAVATEFRPDVILLDIGLPGKDGYRVVRELRAIPVLANSCVVATTGYGREEDRARCLATGFDGHITKPIEPGELQRILTETRAGQ